MSAFLFVRYTKKKININNASQVQILSSLRLSARDLFLVIHCGPDVIAFTLNQGGACLMGKWSYEEWTKSATKSEE
ncbi:MAG: hypothetical protein IJR94_06885 [Synergistaceae bacterium]|nr:hypothetical protein [Synergistaceae bacterium]